MVTQQVPDDFNMQYISLEFHPDFSQHPLKSPSTVEHT